MLKIESPLLKNFLLDTQSNRMSLLTRDALIKSIVSFEMVNADVNYVETEYDKHLKSVYHKWEHESSDALCVKYNQINSTSIDVDCLSP